MAVEYVKRIRISVALFMNNGISISNPKAPINIYRMWHVISVGDDELENWDRVNGMWLDSSLDGDFVDLKDEYRTPNGLLAAKNWTDGFRTGAILAQADARRWETIDTAQQFVPDAPPLIIDPGSTDRPTP